MSNKLLYRPMPFPDEGLNGFILRLATGNQITTVRKLFDGKRFSPEVLVRRLGVQPEMPEFQRMFRQDDCAGNHPVWNKRTSRYCPYCLREHVYWRQEWELSLITICPRHNCYLIEECQKCKHSLTWGRSMLNTCMCGNDLRNANSLQADVKEYKLTQILVNKLYGEDSDIKYLRPLDINQLHNLIIMLGVYANPQQRRTLRDQKITTFKEAQSLVNIAADVLLNWPKGFYQMLDLIQQSFGADDTARLGQRFGRFYSYLYSKYKGRKFGFLLHAFENYLEKNWRHALAGRNKRLSGRLRNKHIWVPASTIAKELNAGLKQIVSLIDLGEIESSQIITTKGRKVLCVNRQQTDLIRGLIKDRVDLKMAAEILGIQEKRVRQLFEHHLLGRVIGPHENNSGRWRIYRSALDQILAIGYGLPEWDSLDFADKCNFEHILRFLLHKRYLFPRLIIGVIREEILPVAVDKNFTGLKAWVFDSKNLKQWISNQVHGMRDGAMTIPEVSKVLKIKQEVAYHLVKKGLLKFILEQDSFILLIKLSSLDEFMKTYVPGIELSRQLNTSPKHLAEILSSKSVFPVTGLVVDEGRQNFYRRDSLLDEAMNHYLETKSTKC